MNGNQLAALAVAITMILFLPILAQAQQPEPVTADPASLAAHVTLPDGLGLPDGGVVMSMSAVNTETNETTAEEYRLIAANGPTVFALSRADQSRLGAQQAAILAWMEDDIEVDGTFSLTIDPCHLGRTPGRSARVSIALRTAAGEPFHMLVDNERLRRLLAEPLSDMPACPQAG